MMRVPFFELHDWQSGWMFTMSLLPPRETGTTWSTVRETSSRPQHRHLFPYRCFRSDHSSLLKHPVSRDFLRHFCARTLSGLFSRHRRSVSRTDDALFRACSLFFRRTASRFAALYRARKNFVRPGFSSRKRRESWLTHALHQLPTPDVCPLCWTNSLSGTHVWQREHSRRPSMTGFRR